MCDEQTLPSANQRGYEATKRNRKGRVHLNLAWRATPSTIMLVAQQLPSGASITFNLLFYRFLLATGHPI
jgi:hypothetical protein